MGGMYPNLTPEKVRRRLAEYGEYLAVVSRRITYWTAYVNDDDPGLAEYAKERLESLYQERVAAGKNVEYWHNCLEWTLENRRLREKVVSVIKKS